MEKLILSLAPIILLIVTIIKFKIRIAISAMLSCFAAIVISVIFFRAPIRTISTDFILGMWGSLSIFLVIISSLLLYEVLKHTSTIEKISKFFQSVVYNEWLLIAFLGWGFSSFLQSITGFGVPIAMVSPLLVLAGVTPIKAISIAILGHAWGGTFGTLAIAWDNMLFQVSGQLDQHLLTLITGLFLWFFNMLSGFAIYFLFRGNNFHIKELLSIPFFSFLMGGGQFLFVRWSTSSACMMGSILGIVGILVVDRFCFKTHLRSTVPKYSLAQQIELFLPFLLLTCLVVAINFSQTIRTFLEQFVIQLNINSGGIKVYTPPLRIFSHSGTLILLSTVVTIYYYVRINILELNSLPSIMMKALRKSLFSVIPIIFLITMSKVMENSGQIDVIANTVASLAKGFYPLISPLIGLLGSFITSSNMSSNIIFSGFQYNVAQLAQINPEIILAAQTSGGSVGNLIATNNIMMGVITTDEVGHESNIFKALMPIAILSGVFLGLLALFAGRVLS